MGVQNELTPSGEKYKGGKPVKAEAGWPGAGANVPCPQVQSHFEGALKGGCNTCQGTVLGGQVLW